MTMVEEAPILPYNLPDFYEVEGTLVSISTTSNTVHVLDNLENIISRASEKGWPKKTHIRNVVAFCAQLSTNVEWSSFC